MAEPQFAPVISLDKSHDRDGFDCGSPVLDSYLRQYALQNQKRGIVRNYVTTLLNDNAVIAYYSLVYSEISRDRLPAKIVKGLGKYDIPAMLLARLAVDSRHQRKGLGIAMLKDAILRTIGAARIAGLKLLIVDAKDERAAEFYAQNGFVPLVDQPLRLYLPIQVDA